VQQIYRWPSRDFRLKMTSSHYYTPNGRNISKTLRRDDDAPDPGGVDPDVPVAQKGTEVDEIQSRLDRFEPPREYLDRVRALALALEFEVPNIAGPDEDPVLAAALAELGKAEQERDR
jgi:hypothetical protein